MNVNCGIFALLALFMVGTGSFAYAGPIDDPRDQTYVSAVVNRVLETERTNVEVPWINPETGNHGVIAVERTFYRDPTTPCRAYHRTVESAGSSPLVINGIGCRIGPAIWSLDETPPSTPLSDTKTTPPTPPASSPSTPTTTPPPASDPASKSGSTSKADPAPKKPRSSAPKQAAKSGGSSDRSDAQSGSSSSKGSGSAETSTPPAKPPSIPSYTVPSKAPI